MQLLNAECDVWDVRKTEWREVQMNTNQSPVRF